MTPEAVLSATADETAAPTREVRSLCRGRLPQPGEQAIPPVVARLQQRPVALQVAVTLLVGEFRLGERRGRRPRLKLNRYDPQNFVWYTLAALGFLFEGSAERTSERAVAALKVRPAWRAAVRAAADARAALGHVEESASLRRQWSEAPPSADALAPLWRCNLAWAARMESLTWRA